MSVLNFFPYVLEDDEDVAKVVKKQLKMKIEERIKQDKQRIKQYKEAIDKMIHALFELERRLKP